MQKVVIVLIHNDEHDFLSLRRAKGTSDGIIWGFPSGKVERGETEKDAVYREVFEETGILCQPRQKIGERIVGDIELSYWTATVIGGQPRDPISGEISDVAFRSSAALQKLIPVERMHPVVRTALKIEEKTVHEMPTLKV